MAISDKLEGWGPPYRDDANREAIEALRKALHNQHAIAFIGAGAAAPRIPTWGDLIIRMTEVLSKRLDVKHKGTLEASRRLAEEGENLLGAASLLSTIARDEIPNVLTIVLKAAMGRYRTTEVYRCLARLPFRGFVTTNYDSGLAQAISQRRSSLVKQTTPVGEGVVEWLNERNHRVPVALPVMHLHGLPYNSLVFGEADYYQHYHKPEVKVFLTNLSFRQLVFVGFGFHDPYFDHILEEVYKPFEKFNDQLNHFAIQGIADNSDWTVRRNTLANQYRAEAIFFPVRTNARTGKKDFGALIELLDWLKSPPRRSQPRLAKSTMRSTKHRPSIAPPLSDAQLTERIARAIASAELPEFLLKRLFKSRKPLEWRLLLSCRQIEVDPDDEDALNQSDQILRKKSKGLDASLLAWSSVVVGMAHLRNNDLEAAEIFYERARTLTKKLKIYPQRWEIHHLGARLAMSRGKYTLAAKRLDRVRAEVDERDSHQLMELRIERAWSALACGDIERAFANFIGMFRAFPTDTDESRIAETPTKVLEAWGYWISSLYGLAITKLLEGDTTLPPQLLADYQCPLQSLRYVFGTSLQAPLYPLVLITFKQPVKITNHPAPPEPLLLWWMEFRTAQVKKRYDVKFGKLEELTPTTWISTLAGLVFLARRERTESSSWKSLKAFLLGSTRPPRLRPLVNAYYGHIKSVFADREVPELPGR